MRVESPFAPFLEAQGFAVLDGGLATALEASGHALDTPLWSARLVLEAPDAVRAAHTAYLEAGADCVTSAGYQASFEGLAAAGLDRAAAEVALRRAVDLAVEARDRFWADEKMRSGRLKPIVAASAGPYGAFLADGSEYDGRYGVGADVLGRFHRDRLDVLGDTPADVVAFETIPSLPEAEAIAGLLAERADAPAWISFTCRDARSLRDGTPIEEAVGACSAVGSLVAVGVNCTAPGFVGGLIERIAHATALPIIAYPNSGESYDRTSRRWTGPGDDWLDRVPDWVRSGARIVGGCCRVGPDRIRELSRTHEGSRAR